MRKGYNPKAKLGSGSRFKTIAEGAESEYVKKGYSQKKSEQIGGAVAAKAGMKKFGKSKMAALAASKKK